MEKNEIKKLIYKNKPGANLMYIRKGSAYYSALIINKDEEHEEVLFNVPVSDMGDADFNVQMESQFLLRWLM